VRSVAGIFWFLSTRSLRNRLRQQAKRLTSPRYAIALLVGIGYFWFFLIRPAGGRSPLSHVFSAEAAQVVVSLFFAVLVAWWWVSGTDRSALAFSPAEVQFLFPAPLTRRSLIQYKLLSTQLAILLSVLLWILLLGRAGSGLAALQRALALWVLFSTVTLHKLGASLVRESTLRQGTSGLRRNILPIGIVTAAFLVLAWSLAGAAPALREAAGTGRVMETLLGVLRSPPASVVLWPVHRVIAPAFASAPDVWLRAMGPALIIMLLHFAWVLRSDTAFEEAAVEASARRAAHIAALRNRSMPMPRKPGKKLARAWFPLRSTGDPAVAIVWKNLIAMTRQMRVATLVLVVVIVVGVFAVMTTRRGGPSLMRGMGVLLVSWSVMLVLFGPHWIRNDLRQDLLKLDLLKGYPIGGARLVAAEIASSALVLTVVQYALCALAAIVFLSSSERPLGAAAAAPGVAVAIAVVLPILNAIGLTIQNGTALLFPAWVRLGATRGAGIEAMGQNLLTMLGSVVAMLVMLLLPLVSGSLVAGSIGLSRSTATDPWAVARAAATWWSALAGAAVAFALIVLELWLLIRWLGRVYERTDPSSVGAPI
jgi:hypothetical protein